MIPSDGIKSLESDISAFALVIGCNGGFTARRTSISFRECSSGPVERTTWIIHTSAFANRDSIGSLILAAVSQVSIS